MIQRCIFLSIGVLILATAPSIAQVYDPNSGIQYRRGQDVVPAFEGWQRNTDGTYSFWFGYLNRNYEEEIDAPVGPNNSFEPASIDRGQPAHFYTRRHMFAFKVIVPKDWPADQKLTWTLTTNGHTSRAKGSLNPASEVNNGVISENAGGGTVDPSNEAPTITGSGKYTVTLPDSLTLTASATDDGRPKPKPQRRRGVETAPKVEEPTGIPSIIPESMRRRPGLGVKWILYRGPGEVTFDPPEQAPVYGQPVTATTKALFSAPGTYWVRAIAGDGALESFLDITVTVNPGK
jgi:hypothetical protein